MNDFGLVQLIWIKRLVSETARINTLIECNRLSKKDLNRYKSVISAIDDFCAFVINSQNWRDVKNIPKIVEEVEMVLFQHFYEQIDAFEDEEVHLDLSRDDEVNLKFKNPLIEDQRFDVIDDESYMDLNVIKGLEDSLSGLNEISYEDSFAGPVLEGEVIGLPEEIEFEINNENPITQSAQNTRETKHTKYDDDNMRRKCKHIILDNLLYFINSSFLCSSFVACKLFWFQHSI